ncbi:MAG: SDR family oxidoreductase [Thermoplasmatales archaeon]|nr:MAG: SDR family oxidoreductase [Thermoplasmatales archaeon]
MIGKTIVITGGAGFIGSNLVGALFRENEVIVIDDLSTGHLENIKYLIDEKSISFVKGSTTDLGLLQKTFKNVNYVFHEAAIPSVPRSIKDPVKSNYANVNGTLNVLVAARDNDVEKVVYASSSSVYGDTPTLPKKEDMNPNPMSPYAVSKVTGEYYCTVFNEVYELATASLRYFNVYGPRQDPSSEYAAVIPRFIYRVLNDKSPIVYGDGLQTRDFTYIKDVVNANILAAESNATGNFNIAGGKRISINDLARIIMKTCRKDLDFVYKNPRPGDIMHSLADISKAKEKLAYEPDFDLTRGLEETIEWYLSRK